MIRLYFIGVSILITAILANYIIGKIAIASWYDYLNYLFDENSTTITKLSILDYLWLFLGYPFVLGLGYLFGEKIYQLVS